MRCAICYQFVQFKKCEKHPWRVFILVFIYLIFHMLSALGRYLMQQSKLSICFELFPLLFWAVFVNCLYQTTVYYLPVTPNIVPDLKRKYQIRHKFLHSISYFLGVFVTIYIIFTRVQKMFPSKFVFYISR